MEEGDNNMHQTIADSFNQTLLDSQSRILENRSSIWDLRSRPSIKAKNYCEKIFHFFKDHFSLLFILVILVNMGIKIYLFDWKTFSQSEYGIFSQVLLICTVGVMKSSVLGGRPNIKSFLVTFFCTFIDLKFVKYIGKNKFYLISRYHNNQNIYQRLDPVFLSNSPSLNSSCQYSSLYHFLFCCYFWWIISFWKMDLFKN